MNDGYKKLTRSKMNRMICGVCGGIAEYLGIDPTLVRLLWALTTLVSCGVAVIGYLVAALVIPEEG